MEKDYVLWGSDDAFRMAFRVAQASHVGAFLERTHHLSRPLAQLLTETVLGASLLSTVFVDEEQMLLKIDFEGELLLVAEILEKGKVRAYVWYPKDSPFVEDIQLGVRFYTNMTVRSVRRHKKTGQIYEGVTQCAAGRIDVAMNDHIERSFQTAVAVRIDAFDVDGTLEALGCVWQELPQLSEKESEILWTHVRNLPTMKNLWLEGADPDVLVPRLLPYPFRLHQSHSLEWLCPCSVETFSSYIKKMDKEERAYLFEKEKIEVECQYCRTKYEFFSKDYI